MQATDHNQDIKYLYYTNEQMTADLQQIVNMIKSFEWKPDLILGLTRGGLVPAVILSHHYDIPMVPINLSLRDFKSDYDTVIAELNQITPKYLDGKYENILVVDDILDSGDTLDELSRILALMDREVNLNIKYATLFYNISNERNFRPHFYGQTIDKSVEAPWIVFPFENALK